MTVSASIAETMPGLRLLDATTISADRLQYLFGVLFLTLAGVFVLNNALIGDAAVWQRTAPIGFACLALMLVLYALTSITRSVAWGLALSYILLLLAIYSRSMLAAACVYLVAAYGLVSIRGVLRQVQKAPVDALMMAMFATVVIAGTARWYTAFDMIERLHAGALHPDTLFHASIGAMIKNYGIASTGLHGLVQTPYYVVSHSLMAGISQLSGAPVLEVYGVAPQILFAPILIFGITACALALRQGATARLPLAWGTVCLVLLLAPRLLQPWRGASDAFFISESHLVALGLLSTGLPLLFRQSLDWRDVALAALLAWLISHSKASVGLIYAGLWGVRVLFLRRTPKDFLGLLLVAGLVFLMVRSMSAATDSAVTRIAPFAYINDLVWLGGSIGTIKEAWAQGSAVPLRLWGKAALAVSLFVTFHFLFSWLVVAGAASKQGMRAIIRTPASLYALGAAGAGISAVGLFYMPGGSVGYFSGVALFVSLPVVMAWTESHFGERLAQSSRPVMVWILAALIALAIALGAGRFKSLLRHSTYLGTHDALAEMLLDARDRVPVESYIQPRPELATMSNYQPCWARPFLYSAVSERPWVSVIPPDPDCTYKYYGYTEYGIIAGHSPSVAPMLLPGMARVVWPPANDSGDNTADR